MKTKEIRQAHQIPQNVFTQWIDLLIMYKRNNLDKEVTFTMKSINEAIEWFNNMKDNMLKGISQEDIKSATDQLVENGMEKNKINKAIEMIDQK
jgi:DNA-binding protein